MPHVRQYSQAIRFEGGPLDGTDRGIKTSPEVEVLFRPLLVFDAESLKELEDPYELSEDLEYVVYRLAKYESGWHYSITEIRSSQELKQIDANRRRSDLVGLIYFASFVFSMVALGFGIATLTQVGGLGFNGPQFALYFLCWIVASMFGLTAAAIAYSVSGKGPAFVCLALLCLLTSPLGFRALGGVIAAFR